MQCVQPLQVKMERALSVFHKMLFHHLSKLMQFHYVKPHLGVPSEQEINEVIEAIKNSKFPVLLAGMRSSSQAETEAIRRLVQKTNLPVVETFQGAGVISRELENHFFGRVGLFRNQVGDNYLEKVI